MPSLNEDIVNDVVNRAGSLDPVPGVRTVAISLGYTFVELDNGAFGVCFTPRSTSGSCAHYAKAGTLSTRPATELARLMLSGIPLEKSVGVAAVNALSRTIMDLEPEAYKDPGPDILDLLPFNGEKLKTGMVGHIGPFITNLVKRSSSLVIVDDNEGLLPGFMQSGYTVSRDVKDLADVDILLITGSSAAVGDFDEVLSAAKKARFIGVVGPSAGWLPDAAFRRGVHAVASMKIMDTASVRRAILEGGGTPHFSACCQKYTILNRKPGETV
ncbi:MAG: DUF364 domain-containing protein [Desulfobacteraceae bacterium]|jgi:hypothetical protein